MVDGVYSKRVLSYRTSVTCYSVFCGRIRRGAEDLREDSAVRPFVPGQGKTENSGAFSF